MRQQRTSRLRLTVQASQPKSAADILWRTVAKAGQANLSLQISGAMIGITLRRPPEFVISGSSLTVTNAVWLPFPQPEGAKLLRLDFSGPLPDEFELRLPQSTDAIMNAVGGRLAAGWSGFPVSPGAAPLLNIAALTNDSYQLVISWATNAPFMLSSVINAVRNTTTNEPGLLVASVGRELTWDFPNFGLNQNDQIQIGVDGAPIVSNWGERIVYAGYVIP